jgi:hypothetical protein
MISNLSAFIVRLGEIRRADAPVEVRPDEASLRAAAARLGLVALPAFEATVTLTPWLDGAEIAARWTAEATQTCGVSLEDFTTPLAGDFTVRVLPPDSPHAPSEASVLDLDPDAEDPADVLEDDRIDVGAYLIEHLSLALDPFPRKPGVAFEPPEAGGVISPFAALRDLKR